MFIPSELGYGEAGSPPSIDGGSALVFTMEIGEGGGRCSGRLCVSAASHSPPPSSPHPLLCARAVEIEGDKVPAARCDIATLEGCSDLEAAFVRKQALKGKDERARELARLEGLVASKTAPEKVAWMKARLALLRRIVKDEL